MSPVPQAIRTKKANKPSNKLTWFEKDLLTPQSVKQALWGVIDFYTGNPTLVDWAAKIIAADNVPERNNTALVRSIVKYAQNRVKYFREQPERFASPLRTIKWGLGDCDDKSILIASTLRSFRIPIRLKFLRFSYFSKSENINKTVQHVYPQAKLDNKWTSLESVHKWPIGMDSEALLTKKGIKSEVSYLGDS